MRKLLTAAGICILLGSSGQTVYAGGMQDWAVSGYVGMASFADTETRPDPFRPHVSHEISSDDAYKIGFILSKYVYTSFSVNLGIEFTNDIDLESDGQVLGEHSHIPVSLGINYHFDTTVLDPYIGAGVGYSFNEGSPSDFIAQQGISTDADNSTFWFVTAGAELPVSSNAALFAAGQYTVEDMEGTGSIRGMGERTNETSMDRYELNIGVKYFF